MLILFSLGYGCDVLELPCDRFPGLAEDLRNVLCHADHRSKRRDPYRWFLSIPIKAAKLFTHLIANFPRTPRSLGLGFALPGREKNLLVLPGRCSGF